MLQTEIEINAPPSKVREVLLDNSRYKEWVTTLVRKLSPDNPSQALESLQAGDKVQCDMDGMQFTAVIKENSDTLFQWQGPPVYGLIAGLHGFHMEPTNGGLSTLFKQTETYTGIISFAMSPSLLGKKLLGSFRQFNKDLKARVETLNKT